MARLVIVSNRVSLPGGRGSRAGGLAVAMRDALRRYGGLWFGWSGEINDHATTAPDLVTSGKVTYATVDLTPADYEAYYVRYANGMLWPLLHYRLDLFEYGQQALEGYLRVNGALADSLLPLLQPDDLIWIHDYHLIPLAAELRKRGVGSRIGFFLHTPFPTTEILTALPGHEILVESMCAYDLVGFQTQNDVHAFRGYIETEAGGRLLPGNGFSVGGRHAHAAAFPIGIDTEGFVTLASDAASSPDTVRLRQSLVGRDLMIGVDRLDYSKGLGEKFEAFQQLLAGWPEHRSRVTMLQVAPYSRSDVTPYRAIRRDLEGKAGHINGRFAEFDWSPVRYMNSTLSRRTLAGFYRISHIGLVTPLRDGMNLVAKEYVASQNPEDPGVLVLSRFAGAARELSGALIVNPFDIGRIAEAMHQGLVMPLEERQARWQAMMAVLRRNTIETWRESFLKALRHRRAPPPFEPAARPIMPPKRPLRDVAGLQPVQAKG